MKGKLTYAKAGVDILAKDSAIDVLTEQIKFKRAGIGRPIITSHYAGIVDLPGDYAVGITTDGVGTKILIANEMKKWDTLGIDCIAMNVNDMLAMNMEPVAFVDYLAFEKVDDRIARGVGAGLAKGAKISNMSVVGGETAVLGSMINGFDLAGTCVGFVRKDRIITGKDIKVGDAVIGLRSSGIHSNGLTLARKVVERAGYSYRDACPFNKKIRIGEELLRPTKIYMEILKLTKKCKVHGLAHITGSGLLKLKRITKYGFDFHDPLKPQQIFSFLQRIGGIGEREMYRTFNMGMGFVAIVPRKEAEKALRVLGGGAKLAGEIVEKEIRVKGLRID